MTDAEGRYADATMDDWEAKLEQAQKTAQPGPVFVVWVAGPKAGEDAASSWCPDCNRVVPAVRAAAQELHATLLEVSVGPPAVYKAPEFFLRTAPEYQPFKGVPHLVAYRQGQIIGKAPDSLESASHEAGLGIAKEFIGVMSGRCTSY